MSLPTPLSSTETLAPAPVESQLSWSQQLKERLERLQKPSSPAFELYPGTPVYIARRRLEDTIAATWRAQLLKLVRADLAAGKSGRRKHYWEESQCLVVYELIDGAAALQACPDGASEAAREAYLARTCKDALYVIVPQFAAHTTSAWPSPTRSETKLPASDVHPSLVTPPMSPPLQSAETVDPLSRPALTQRHTVAVAKSTSPTNSDSSIADAPAEKLPSPHTLDSIPLHILHPRPLPRHPALILTTPEVADSDSADVHREASDNAKSNTSEMTTGPTPTSPSPVVPAAASLTSPLSPSMSITPPLSPAPGLGLDIAAQDATAEHEHEDEHEEHEHEDEEEDFEEAAVVTGYWLRPEHFSPTAAPAVDLVVDPSPEVQASGHAIEEQEEDEDVPHVLFKSLNPQLSLDVEVERRSRSNSPALVPVVALEGEIPRSPTLSIGFKELNEHIGLNAEIERISRSPSPVGSIRSVHSHTSFTSDGREVTFKTLNEQFSLDVEAQRRSSLSPMHSPVRSERFVMLQGQDEASPKEEQARSPSPLPSPGEGIAASLAAASFALAATTSGQQGAIENDKKDSRALTRTNNQRGLVLRTFILPFSAAYFILNVFNPFSYRSFFALRRQHPPLLPTSSSADTPSQPKLTVGSSKPLLVPRFIWRWAGKDAEYNLARVGLGKGVNTLGARYDGAGGLVDVA